MNRPQARILDPREYCHERLKDRFADAMSAYDISTRLSVLTGDFLTDEMVAGKAALDVGCGLGHFSERLKARGAVVSACDIGEGLLEQTRQRVDCHVVVADAMELTKTFGDNKFDLVLSSECIEHTPDPGRALTEMVSVLKTGGYLVLSTPNRLWQPVVRMATWLKLRPFDGYENFSTFRGIRHLLRQSGAEVQREVGLHLFPFQFRCHGLSGWCDSNLQILRGCMINLCILAKKTR